MNFDSYGYPYQGLGGGHGLPSGEPSDPRKVKAVLWVIDPEMRHGWREVYVVADAKKPRRQPAMGFPGKRRR